ncbi:hypothetical protein SCLARK_00508 [Spiroplasma clarkii]|uniref:Uncharacterized protein n=1 Tax=Spiroplasma clarkii TaxID=2139 RepID=A0A1Y0KZL5_9MOLU|nr:hypothetical protein [Spiroplasma clarkii]ARU91202.1 hypothetical protein SCLARK_00508 [Spiroplasma clarkii]ATX70641.1 hypothetical protein SCLAR_v1c03110 [Spiroplasma clarkii]
MKVKVRTIDNTEWITNIFLGTDNLYLVDARFEQPDTTIYSIKTEALLENLKDQADVGRMFLANPLPYISKNGLASKMSDVEVKETVSGYVQRITFFAGQRYLSLIVDQKVVTKKECDEKLVPVQILQVLEDKMLAIKDGMLVYLDENLQVVTDLKIPAVNAIVFDEKIVYQKADNSIWVKDSSTEQILCDPQEFVSIFYLNKANVLVSYKEQNFSKLINISTKEEMHLCDFYVYRAVVVNSETLICKPLFDKNKQQNLDHKIVIIK